MLTRETEITLNDQLRFLAEWAIDSRQAVPADMELIRDQYRRSSGGGHWFDPGAMRFFRTRLAQSAYVGPGGIFFVSSECPPDGTRGYSVRQFDPLRGAIDTVGDFCATAHRSTADRRAKRLAEGAA